MEMTEPKYEEFRWIKTSGDPRTGFMQVHFGTAPADPMPFILAVTPTYVAHKTQKTLPTELQNYCDNNREALREIAFNCKQRGKNAEVL
jgi:hypothetical protein